jgi:glycosyltransferase involved in cell wall biosynthesis
MQNKKINYYSYSLESGYGSSAKAYLRIMSQMPHCQVNHYICSSGVTKITPVKEVFDPKESDINFIHCVPTEALHLRSSTAKNIICTVYETDKLTSYIARAINLYDEITVPCHWNFETFSNYTNKKIHLLPHLSEYNGKMPETSQPGFLKSIDSDTFVFLNVSAWVTRKNIENMILAYSKAFKKTDKVIFIFKTSEIDISKRYWSNLFFDRNVFRKSIVSYSNIMRDHQLDSNIHFIDHRLSTDEMMHLYHRADCYFTMTNSEGWGMGSYESAHYGKPVIATNFSGHLDFLNDDNSFLIPSKTIPFKLNPWDDKYYYKGFTMAEPDFDSAVDLLRLVYQNRNLGQIKGKKLQQDVRNKFSEERIEKILKQILS